MIMKLALLTAPSPQPSTNPQRSNLLRPIYGFNPLPLTIETPFSRFSRISTITTVKCSAKLSSQSVLHSNAQPQNDAVVSDPVDTEFSNVSVGSPIVPAALAFTKLGMSDRATLLVTFIVCTTSVAFTSLTIAAVPTLMAMGRAALSLSKLADAAREELPSTMAAIRLSSMEISDLTLELSDLSHEIADGVSKSSQAVQAAEAGIRQIGSLAREQTMAMIQERASLPVISLRPVVAGAAKKTSRAVGQATKSIMNMMSRGENSDGEDGNTVDRIEV